MVSWDWGYPKRFYLGFGVSKGILPQNFQWENRQDLRLLPPFAWPFSNVMSQEKQVGSINQRDDFQSFSFFTFPMYEQIHGKCRIVISMNHKFLLPNRKFLFWYLNILGNSERTNSTDKVKTYKVGGLEIFLFTTLIDHYILNSFYQYLDVKLTSVPSQYIQRKSATNKCFDIV